MHTERHQEHQRTLNPVMGDSLFDLRSEHLAGRRGGRVSICSTRREVLAAALESAASRGDALLVETTANQVNQFGGYSGLTPAAFAADLHRLAEELGVPRLRVWLGADHLGPYAWRGAPAAAAMANALELVRQCVAAGYRKIHVDTGFRCADDPRPELPLETAADRAVALCRAAEDAAGRLAPDAPRPLYVIGAEVPPPGGALDAAHAPEVTPVETLAETLAVYRARFAAARLESAWERVMAVVVQPGVEFGDEAVAAYRRGQARTLAGFHARLPGAMTYEVHSTDYQPAASLAHLVADHFTLLKVGPCLTDAFRQAVFALAAVDAERRGRAPADDIRAVLERVMLQDPVHWQSHYRGSAERLRLLRGSSRRDRIRYYWGHPDVQAALRQLLAALGAGLSPAEIEAYLPALTAAELPGDPGRLIRRRIQLALDPYIEATT
jgi:D-tagatose-1,6-bisphosphate aldolase subunit GatZ/KbaZ